MTAERLLPRDRQARILDRLARDGEVRCLALAQALGVSIETVRRDLTVLERRGQAKRLHGGATAIADQVLPQIDLRIGVDAVTKERIGARAATLVAQDMSVFVGGGSTALAAARAMRNGPHAVFASTMLDVVVALSAGGQDDVTLLGGRFNRFTRSFVGFETMEMIGRRVFDLAFIGVRAIDARRGLLGPSERHLELTQTVRRHARRLVVLATATAFGREDRFAVLPLRDVDVLVTDRAPPADIYAALDDGRTAILF